jgi:hypothetical protein
LLKGLVELRMTSISNYISEYSRSRHLKMKSIYFIFAFLSLPHSLHAQTDTVYEKHMYEFINQIRYSQFDYPRTDTLLIKNFLSNKSMFLAVPFVAFKKSHPNFLSDTEINELIVQFNNDSIRFNLKENRIRKSKLISDSAIEILDKGNFRERYCSYWHFSKPCFVRNYTICAFSYEICDEQSTVLYQKINDKWLRVFEIGRP